MADIAGLADIWQMIPELAKPFVVFIAVFAFLYASLGRSAIFHFEARARAVLSGALALYAANLVLVDSWDLVIRVTAAAVAGGMIGVILYHVLGQRGQTRQQATEVVEVEEDR